MILSCIIAFFGGAVFEAACVGWVHYAALNKAGMTSLFAMLCAAAQVAGIGESVHTLVAAPFFVLGYGAGTYGAVKLKQRWG